MDLNKIIMLLSEFDYIKNTKEDTKEFIEYIIECLEIYNNEVN